MVFGTIEQAIDDIRAGKFVIVADDEDRENEGDLICAAQLVTPEMINFMIKKAGGMICLALTGERVDALGPRADGGDEPRRLSHRVHGDDRRVAALRRDHGHQRAGSRDDDSRRRRPRGGARRTCGTAGTCFRCARAKAACSSASATPRRRSTSRGSPACCPPA